MRSTAATRRSSTNELVHPRREPRVGVTEPCGDHHGRQAFASRHASGPRARPLPWPMRLNPCPKPSGSRGSPPPLSHATTRARRRSSTTANPSLLAGTELGAADLCRHSLAPRRISTSRPGVALGSILASGRTEEPLGCGPRGSFDTGVARFVAGRSPLGRVLPDHHGLSQGRVWALVDLDVSSRDHAGVVAGEGHHDAELHFIRRVLGSAFGSRAKAASYVKKMRSTSRLPGSPRSTK